MLIKADTVYIYPTSSPSAECDTKSIFKLSKTGEKSVSFS